MEETVYEWMERIRLVDRLLAAFAVLLPLVVGACWWAWGRRPVVARHRPLLAMLIATPPVLWGLWQTYSAIMNHYGLDSIFALVLNAAIFIAAGVAVACLCRRV